MTMGQRYELQDYWGEQLVVHGDNEYLRRFAELRADRFDPRILEPQCWTSPDRAKGPLQWRDELIPQYAWAVPCDEALDCLAQYAPLVEIGAGTGLWAFLLRQRGVDIVAYDLYAQRYGGTRVPMTRHWTEVQRGGVRALRHHPERTLFLCWPPYGRSMARRALQMYRGHTVIYIGEWRAATADEAFHDVLEQEWNQVAEVAIPTFWGMRDRLWCFSRKD